MKPKTLAIHWTKIWYLILTFLIIVFLACGDSDDDGENQPAKPKSTIEDLEDEVIEPEAEVIDFAAEEAAIRELYTSYAAAANRQDVNDMMEHWIERNTKDVFNVDCFGGAMTRIEKWKNIKDSFAATFVLVGKAQMIVTIAEVGVDERGQKATLRGTWEWWLFSGKMVVAFEKDTKGNWKIRAIDHCDQEFIKEIQTPQPE